MWLIISANGLGIPGDGGLPPLMVGTAESNSSNSEVLLINETSNNIDDSLSQEDCSQGHMKIKPLEGRLKIDNVTYELLAVCYTTDGKREVLASSGDKLVIMSGKLKSSQGVYILDGSLRIKDSQSTKRFKFELEEIQD